MGTPRWDGVGYRICHAEPRHATLGQNLLQDLSRHQEEDYAITGSLTPSGGGLRHHRISHAIRKRITPSQDLSRHQEEDYAITGSPTPSRRKLRHHRISHAIKTPPAPTKTPTAPTKRHLRQQNATCANKNAN